MKCYHPVKGWLTANGVVFSERKRHGDYIRDVEVPCGQCIGCRERRASDWALRVMHEAQFHDENCFVTLTYAPGNLPPHGSLDHGDFQKFLKRLRAQRSYRGESDVRFYMCGEYGPETGRAHYHACLFGVGFMDGRKPIGRSGSGSVFYEHDELSKLWGLGRASVQDLNPQTASYCARYIMKKALGQDAKTAYQRVTADGEIIQLKPEYAAMSLKPGIGARWFEKYGRDVFPHDYAVQDGSKRPVPKYYSRKLKKQASEVLDKVLHMREVRAKEVPVSERMPDRLAEIEAVHIAKIRNLSRSNVNDAS